MYDKYIVYTMSPAHPCYLKYLKSAVFAYTYIQTSMHICLIYYIHIQYNYMHIHSLVHLIIYTHIILAYTYTCTLTYPYVPGHKHVYISHAIACNCTQKCTALHKSLDAVPNSFAFVMKRWGSSSIHMSQCAYLCILQPHT